MENKADKQLQFIELRAKGNSFDRISKTLSVSKNTLIEWSRQNKKEIRTLANLEKDALFEAHKLNAEHQVETLGIQLAKIREELSRRDLSEISTERLLNLELKLFESANKIRTPTILYSDEETWEFDIGSEWEG